jgi:hypothetical protein
VVHPVVGIEWYARPIMIAHVEEDFLSSEDVRDRSADVVHPTAGIDTHLGPMSFFHVDEPRLLLNDVLHSVGKWSSSVGRRRAPARRRSSLSGWMHSMGSNDLVLPGG